MIYRRITAFAVRTFCENYFDGHLPGQIIKCISNVQEAMILLLYLYKVRCLETNFLTYFIVTESPYLTYYRLKGLHDGRIQMSVRLDYAVGGSINSYDSRQFSDYVAENQAIWALSGVDVGAYELHCYP